jgi:hypothetical protein
METTTFTALCERAGRWWTIRVPQVEGVTAQVRSLDQAEVVTRQLIARTLAVPVESIRVDVLPDAPAPVAHALQMRHAARQAVEAATRATRDALDALAREGIAFLDAATMLGLSPAEIEQYAPAGTGGGPEQPGVTASPLQPARPLSSWPGATASFLTSSTASKGGDSSHGQAALSVRGSRARQPGRLPAHPRHALPRFTTKATRASTWLSPTCSIISHGRTWVRER